MSIWRTIFGTCVVASSAIGCQNDGIVTSQGGQGRTTARDEYIAVHESAAKTLPWAVELESLYGDADHFITHYGFGQQPLQWNTEVFFAGRYELTMQVDVKVDYKMRRVEPVGKPRFFLTEVETVRKTAGGNDALTFSNQYSFDLAQWRKVYDSHGDFSAIGISLIKKPVPGFSQAATRWRRSRIPISLTTNKPATVRKENPKILAGTHPKEEKIKPNTKNGDRSDGAEREKR